MVRNLVRHPRLLHEANSASATYLFQQVTEAMPFVNQEELFEKKVVCKGASLGYNGHKALQQCCETKAVLLWQGKPEPLRFARKINLT